MKQKKNVLIFLQIKITEKSDDKVSSWCFNFRILKKKKEKKFLQVFPGSSLDMIVQWMSAIPMYHDDTRTILLSNNKTVNYECNHMQLVSSTLNH